MRSFAPAALVCLALAAVIGGWLIATVAHGGSAPAAAADPPPAPAAPAAASPVDNDAPARHARRTACLKEAKSKKLVGAKRTAYVRSCTGASPGARVNASGYKDP